MIKIYREKSKINAERFDGSQKSVFGYKIVPDKPFVDVPNEKPAYYFVLTDDEFKDGVVIEEGDWIINDGTDIYSLDNESFNNRCEQLPVIPNFVADWIEECKQNHISIGDMLCSNMRPDKMRVWMSLKTGTYRFDYARYQKCQELVTRARLDGYQVEAQHD